MDEKKLKERYGESEHGNFAVFDTIAVPHPYMITARHVTFASDHRSGILNDEAIAAAERAGARCGHRGCQLTYKQHEQALLLNCKVAIRTDEKTATPELHAYLLKIKPLCEEDGYAGFAFKERD